MKRSSLFSFWAVAAIVAGCGVPSAPPLAMVASAQMPGGYQLQNAEKYGISIGIPPGWKVASGDYEDPKDALGGVGGDNASTAPSGSLDLAQMLKSQEEEYKKDEAEALAKLEARGIVIHVMSTAKGVLYETPTHFSVSIQPNPAASLSAAADTVLERVPGEAKPAPVKIPAGPAMVIRADKKMRDGGDVTTSKYVLQDGKTMIVVAFVTEADPSVITSIEKPVMDTLRIVPGKAVPPPGSHQ
ncbi:MAG: hypothetical protein ACYC96_10490 [Fimbriimonadaceae bacterium]